MKLYNSILEVGVAVLVQSVVVECEEVRVQMAGVGGYVVAPGEG